MSTECKTITPAIRSLANNLHYLNTYEFEQRLFVWMSHEMKARLAELLSTASTGELLDTESMRQRLIEHSINHVLEFYRPLLAKMGCTGEFVTSGTSPSSLPAWEVYYSFSVTLCFPSYQSVLIVNYCTDKEFV